MKRLVFLSSLTLSLLSITPCGAEQPKIESVSQTFEPFTAKIVGSKVRLRLSPSLEGHIVREVNKGEMFAVVAETPEYYGVRPSNDLKAYIVRTHVFENKVEGNRVNVRLQANVDAPVLAQLNSGDAVTPRASDTHGKWLEIAVPQNVRFWIAKDYVEKVGPLEYAEKYQQRLAEASQLLATADLISQTEFRKSFSEIDLARVTKNFERLINDYRDLEHIQARAKEAVQELQKNYCDRKIAFLENRAVGADSELKSLNAKLASLNVNELEQSSNRNEDSPFDKILKVDSITDKMKIWQPLELSIYQTWAQNQAESNLKIKDFYEEELLSSNVIQGIVQPFDNIVKNKPGDFTLTQNNHSIAYLYSTHVNLQDYIGKQITMKVTERDNHNFAFPAYYVLEVK